MEISPIPYRNSYSAFLGIWFQQYRLCSSEARVLNEYLQELRTEVNMGHVMQYKNAEFQIEIAKQNERLACGILEQRGSEAFSNNLWRVRGRTSSGGVCVLSHAQSLYSLLVSTYSRRLFRWTRHVNKDYVQ